VPPLGGTRFQRAVIVVQDGKVVDIKVEPESGKCEYPPSAATTPAAARAWL
jgi:peroxiredoxin